jgi:predicted short-subunit dehydrogenase-like oxidoreductase (DUF2520 family)
MVSTLQSSRRGVATATVVGRGRLGRPVARALRAAGVRVNGPTGRGEFVASADVVLLCVPDAEIAGAAASLGRTGMFVGHMSGATPLTAVDFGIHPLQTFVGDEGPDAFRGIGCAVEGRSPHALAVARELARLLGARPFEISDHQRAGYHAAASLASNLILSVLAAAEEMAAAAGIAPEDARALLAPLAQSTVRNWVERGSRSALTGPIVRGDTDTVQRQRDAVEAGAPELLPLFDALCTSTRALVATEPVTP